MPESRQIAVVMFTDLIGYTALMQHDEVSALEKLNRYKQTLQQLVPACNGTIIQYFGDGGLVIFSNTEDALSCSAQLQKAFLQSPQIPVRIGMHLGDILIKEGNVFGDCVNVTSRIESMGIAGAVLVSETVQQQLKNKPRFQFVSLGWYEFKNVEERMQIFALTNDHLPLPDPEIMTGKFKDRRREKSIAVLPFVNMSNDVEQEYIGDGIAEEIINALVHLEDLDVAGRTSSFQFKGKNMDLREVGAKLGVSNVLEGSIRRQGNRLRITAQLIKVEDGYHIWSERYDREMDDVFAIQDEIALSISEKLLVTLAKRDTHRITKIPTESTEAYDLYLKGRFKLDRRGASLLSSLQLFQEAIRLDPDFALAHSGFADANVLIATYGLIPPRNVFDKARHHAEKALQIDPGLHQPYCTLGYYHTCYDWNWTEAKKNFELAITINPNFAEGHARYGLNYLCWIERNFEEAEKHGAMSIKLEPLSAICYANYSMILLASGKYKEGLTIVKTGIDLDANSYLCHINAGRIYMALHQYDNAVDSFMAAMKLTNRHHFTVNALIWIYCIKKEFDSARKLMAELKQRSATEYIAKTFTAVSAAFLGDIDDAIDLLEQASADRDPTLVMLNTEQWIPKALLRDPRYEAIIKRMNLPV